MWLPTPPLRTRVIRQQLQRRQAIGGDGDDETGGTDGRTRALIVYPQFPPFRSSPPLFVLTPLPDCSRPRLPHCTHFHRLSNPAALPQAPTRAPPVPPRSAAQTLATMEPGHVHLTRAHGTSPVHPELRTESTPTWQ